MTFEPYSGNRQSVNSRGRTNVKAQIGIWMLVLTVIGLASCSDSQSIWAPPELAGPALVMFYTDN
jgi:hypothetical protein